MHIEDLDQIEWQQTGDYYTKSAWGITLLSLRRPVQLQSAGGPQTVLTLQGRGRMLIGEEMVLASAGVAVTLHPSERLQVVPGDEGMLLLRCPAQAATAEPVFRPGQKAEPVPNPLTSASRTTAPAHEALAATDTPRGPAASVQASSTITELDRSRRPLPVRTQTAPGDASQRVLGSGPAIPAAPPPPAPQAQSAEATKTAPKQSALAAWRRARAERGQGEA